jgi:hypothetical protein
MLCLTFASSACGRLGFSGDSSADAGDDAAKDAAVDAPGPCPSFVWKAERVLSELKLSSDTVWSYAWGHGDQQIVFEVQTSTSDLFIASFNESTGRFDTPRALTEINTNNASESSPTLSEDGLELFYTFNVAGGTNSIRRATRPSPTAMFGPSAFVTDGIGPDLGRGDLDLVYETGNKIMIRSRGSLSANTFGPESPLLSINSGGGWPSLSGDGNELYYQTGEGLPPFMTRRRNREAPFEQPWAAPTYEAGADPDISSDGQRLLYVTFQTGEPTDPNYNVPKLTRRVCATSQ